MRGIFIRLFFCFSLFVIVERTYSYEQPRLGFEQMVRQIQTELVPTLAPEELDKEVDKASSRLLRQLLETDLKFKGINTSKLNRYISNSFNKSLSLPYVEISDIFHLYSKQRKTVSVYRVEFPDQNSQDPFSITYGFKIDLIDEVDLSELVESPESRTYQTSIGKWYELQFQDREFDFDFDRQLNYPKYTSDGVLKFTVIIAQNLKDLSLATAGHYVKFLEGLDFKLVDDSGFWEPRQYLKNSISGELTRPSDFVILESHGEGDELNATVLPVRSHRIVMNRKGEDFDIEFEILFSAHPKSSNNSDPLTYSDFSEMLIDREQIGNAPLVYLNTSCWSFSKSRIETSLSDGRRLLPVSSSSFTYTFNFKETSNLRLIVEGFMAQKSWREIGTQIETFGNRFADRYIFPDTPRFQNQVLDYVHPKYHFWIAEKTNNLIQQGSNLQ